MTHDEHLARCAEDYNKECEPIRDRDGTAWNCKDCAVEACEHWKIENGVD